jgi:hypothetical protein
MNRNDFVLNVTNVLYVVDPADTFCNMNDMINEYRGEAERIAELFIDEKLTLAQSMFDTFEEKFDGHYDLNKLMKAKKYVNDMLA